MQSKRRKLIVGFVAGAALVVGSFTAASAAPGGGADVGQDCYHANHITSNGEPNHLCSPPTTEAPTTTTTEAPTTTTEAPPVTIVTEPVIVAPVISVEADAEAVVIVPEPDAVVVPGVVIVEAVPAPVTLAQARTTG